MIWSRRVASRLPFALLVCLLARPASAQPVALLAADDFVRDWQISKRISDVRPVYEALPKNVTKEVARDWIDKSFDYVIQVLPKLTDKQFSEARFPVNFEGRPGPDINGRDMIMNMFVHVAHHRAQRDVYLRLKGIPPPIYTSRAGRRSSDRALISTQRTRR